LRKGVFAGKKSFLFEIAACGPQKEGGAQSLGQYGHRGEALEKKVSVNLDAQDESLIQANIRRKGSRWSNKEWDPSSTFPASPLTGTRGMREPLLVQGKKKKLNLRAGS